jgi:hypothetical protein
MFLAGAWLVACAAHAGEKAPGSGPVSYGSTVSFDNRSGAPALVKLMGPIGQVVHVPDGARRTVKAAAGKHYILVRYGEGPEDYRYARGKSFNIEDTRQRHTQIEITLHKVVGGNYPTHATSRAEFEQAQPAAPPQ